MGEFGNYFNGMLGQAFPQQLLQQQQQALGAYTASGSAWNTAAVVNIGSVDFNDVYAPRRAEKIAPRSKESAVEWLDRRVSEICVKL